MTLETRDMTAPAIEAPRRAWHTVPLVVAGTLAMALSSWIEVPMVPVPMNLQSLTAPLLGMLLGARLGGLSVILWLVEACLGLPVLSGGAAGAHHLIGPTAGYLIAFPISALLCGWLWQRVGRGRLLPSCAIVLIGNMLILGLGVIWLAMAANWSVALSSGLYPFLTGALMKSAIGGALAVLHARARSGSK